MLTRKLEKCGDGAHLMSLPTCGYSAQQKLSLTLSTSYGKYILSCDLIIMSGDGRLRTTLG